MYPKTCEAIEFLEVIEDLFLYQHVNAPTRHGSSGSSTVDLILTNDEFSISDICFKPPLKGSDHSILVCKYRIPFYNSHSVDVYLYQTMNDTLVYKIFDDWKNKFTLNTPIEQLWNNFRSMYDAILSCVPRKRIKKIKGFSYLNKPCFKLALKEKYKL